MPLPRFKTQDEIPEALRSDYVQEGEEWISKTESDLAEEKRKRAQLLDEKKEEERRRKEAETLAAEHKRLLDAKNANIPETELQRLRDEDAQRRAAELDPLRTENDTLKAENRKLKLTDRVRTMALKLGVMPDRIDDAMDALDRRTDLGDKDGIIVKDKDGNVTTETIDHFLSTTFKAEKPWLYEYDGKGGGGKRTSAGSDAPPTQQPAGNRHATVRGAF